MIISVLGEPYSFHHVAAMQYWDMQQHFHFHLHFDELIASVQDGQADFGLIAVENTIAGDVPGNYARVANSGLFIHGEIFLHLDMHLAAKEAVPLSAIHTVISHQMALKETAPFFLPYPGIRKMPVESTSSAAKYVSEQNDPVLAAVANSAAIRFFKLQIISKNIDNLPNNVTRFLILCKKERKSDATPGKIKASMLLRSGIHEGLHQHLRLQRPLENGAVYAECHETGSEEWQQKLNNLVAKGVNIQLLGVYPEGITASGT